MLEAKIGENIKRRSLFAVATGAVLLLLGLILSYGSGILLSLGGSAYYLIVGIALIVSGTLLISQRHIGGLLYLAIYLATLFWALAEVGLQFWPLAPRVIGPTLLCIPVFLAHARLARRQRHSTSGRDGVSPDRPRRELFGYGRRPRHDVRVCRVWSRG